MKNKLERKWMHVNGQSIVKFWEQNKWFIIIYVHIYWMTSNIIYVHNPLL